MGKWKNTRISGTAPTRPQDEAKDDGRWEKYWPIYRDAASRSIDGKSVEGYPYGLMAVIDAVEKDVRDAIAKQEEDLAECAERERDMLRGRRGYGDLDRADRLEAEAKKHRDRAHGIRNPIKPGDLR